MTKASSLVLITTATNPPEGVYVLKMTNVAKRKITAKSAVFNWAALGIQKIVIADATGQTLLDENEVQMFAQLGVELEQIHYMQNNDLVISKGKGYGEGALMKFALHQSKLLQNEENFFKCTGKVYCRNFPEIFNMVHQNNIKNIFWQEAFSPTTIDTRFFYVSKKFAHDSLLSAYENIDDINNICSEHLVMKIAQKNLTQGVSARPMLSGFSGSLNQPYFDASLGYLDQHFSCWASQ